MLSKLDEQKLLPQFRQIVCLVGALRALFCRYAYGRHGFPRAFLLYIAFLVFLTAHHCSNSATTLLSQNKRDKNSSLNSERVLAWWVRAFHADRRIPLRWIPTLTLGMTRGRETRTRCGFVITDCFDFIQTAISIEYLLAVVPSQSVGVFTKGTRLRAFHYVLAWDNATQ